MKHKLKPQNEEKNLKNALKQTKQGIFRFNCSKWILKSVLLASDFMFFDIYQGGFSMKQQQNKNKKGKTKKIFLIFRIFRARNVDH